MDDHKCSNVEDASQVDSLPDDFRNRPIWEVFLELLDNVPEEELDKIPHDGSVNHDYYLYGAPKRVKM